MEAIESQVNPLLERVESFGKSGLELLKLKSVAKTADVGSALISRLMLGVILSLFLFPVNIALSLWLGEMLGKYYYGFLVVGAFYGIIGIVFYFALPMIKERINNSIIKQMLN